MKDLYNQLNEKLKAVGLEEKEGVTVSGIDQVHAWESPYAVVLGVEVENPENAQSLKEIWLAAQYFLDLRISELEGENSYKDAFLVFMVPEMPVTQEAQDVVLAAKYNVSVCLKAFAVEGEDIDISVTDGIELQGVGRKPAPTEFTVGDSEVPLDAQVTVLEGHNATGRAKVEKALTRELRGTQTSLHVLPFDGMDAQERIEWIYRLRAAALLNPELKFVVTTRHSSARQLIQHRFIHLGSEDEPSLRLAFLQASSNGKPKLLSTEAQKVIKALELSLKQNGQANSGGSELLPKGVGWR
jgi:hypothetical protein